MSKIDSSAMGSDVARSRKQYFARLLADLFLSVTGVNGAGYLATEIVQKIRPVCRIETAKGPLWCRGGHGRLVWRAETFYTEEPETVTWLDGIRADDILWDVGANVGLYSLYAAKVAGCKVISFEPEAQNFAILTENVVLNGLGAQIEPCPVPLTRGLALDRLAVHAMTKGGAFNQFGQPAEGAAVRQLQIGCSLDDLVYTWNLPAPTFLKVDVDGIEPLIFDGAERLTQDPRLRSVLVEIRTDLPDNVAIVEKLEQRGFTVSSRRSNWLSRENREGEKHHPVENVILVRG
ncbi:FkbM family methyltransferase [Paramagnetospirillum caucaseum]|uniref:FkbM family methyltransferase n=1 Tax=Paramagnetospirillum caucaseum TaxID=1244869 RepID=M3ACL0_9PROT|nr:FkbM family methyltransferase [Paramagnetospirillum caucaseum]EME70533.1 FkbM family methyltransferase [Paramagnetospirillum caucaseum]